MAAIEKLTESDVEYIFGNLVTGVLDRTMPEPDDVTLYSNAVQLLFGKQLFRIDYTIRETS